MITQKHETIITTTVQVARWAILIACLVLCYFMGRVDGWREGWRTHQTDCVRVGVAEWGVDDQTDPKVVFRWRKKAE